jgi:hypothetical protein
MSRYKRLIFTSNLVNEYGRDLPELLNESFNRNTSLGISSMLLTSHGKLIQLIEGNSNLVNQQWQRIRQDARYFDQRIVTEDMLDAQTFVGTHAGLGRYALLNQEELQENINVFPLIEQEVEQRLPMGSARTLLTNFISERA